MDQQNKPESDSSDVNTSIEEDDNIWSGDEEEEGLQEGGRPAPFAFEPPGRPEDVDTGEEQKDHDDRTRNTLWYV